MIPTLRRTLIAVCFVVTLLVAPGVGAIAQPALDELQGGRTYVVAFPDTTMNTFDARYPNRAFRDKSILFLYSAVDATVSIKGKGYARTLSLTGGRLATVEVMGADSVNAPNPIIIQHCKPVDNTFRIDASQPIIVHQALLTKFGAEMWTAVPVDAWGTRYHAAALEGEIGSDVSPGGEFDYNRKNKMFPAEILVIAAYDDTRITIVPNGQVHNICSATNLTLKAGEAYSMQSYVDTLTANVGGDQPDFGGSRIFSTKPVGVISGNTRAQMFDENIGLGKNSFKNMQIEWLAPVDLYGTEFVYLPTWDALNPATGQQTDSSGARPRELVRVYATSDEDTEVIWTDSLGILGGADELRPIPQGRHADLWFDMRYASLIRTSQPAQVMMHTPGTVRYAGTTSGGGGYIGARYTGWGGHMVELTPRHRWSSFAPIASSSTPGGMQIRVNVVTDTSHRNDIVRANGARVSFDRVVPGTDLVWTTLVVTPGVEDALRGLNGARFFGTVYATLIKGGTEQYTPGRAFGDRNPPPLAHAGGGDDAEILHPSEYIEVNSVAWAYPLSSPMKAMGAGDSLAITVEQVDCSTSRYRVRDLSPDPVGLARAEISDTSNVVVSRAEPFPLTGAVEATLLVRAADARRDARATVSFVDRTGRRVSATFAHTGVTVAIDGLPEGPSTVPISDSVQYTAIVRNPTTRPVSVRDIRLVTSTAFRIRSIIPAVPGTLAPGDSIAVRITVLQRGQDRLAHDTLVVTLSCGESRRPLAAVLARPCLWAMDVTFGTVAPGQSRTLPMQLCNSSLDTLVLDADRSKVVTWSDPRFTIAQATLDSLAGRRFAPGECVLVDVTLGPGSDGTYRAVARIASNSVGCRDTSVWLGSIGDVGAITGDAISDAALRLSIDPNVVSGPTEIRYDLPRAASTTLTIYDATGGRVAVLLDEYRSAGRHTHRLEPAGLAAGVYHCRIVSGGLAQVVTFVLR